MLLSKDGCFRKTMNSGSLGPVRKEGRRHLFGEEIGQGLRNEKCKRTENYTRIAWRNKTERHFS